MDDVSVIDFKKPYGKQVSANVLTQKVFYTQNGIEYGLDRKAIKPSQVKAYYKKIADEAQEAAAQAEAAALAAQERAAELRQMTAPAKAKAPAKKKG